MRALRNKPVHWVIAGLALIASATVFIVRSRAPELALADEDGLDRAALSLENIQPNADMAASQHPAASAPSLPLGGFTGDKSSPADFSSSTSGLPDFPLLDDLPGASRPSSVWGESSPGESADEQSSSYDVRVAVMVDIVQTVRASGSEASHNIQLLLESEDSADQASGLALMAGLGMMDAQRNLALHKPEVVLAAVDLCAALFDDASARTLLDQWTESLGGVQKSGELAHRLLFAGQFPYGGGSTALDLMIGANDPQAALVGLRIFAVDTDLPPVVRIEALLLLRDRMEFPAYQGFVRYCAEKARQEEGGIWAIRAGRLLERVEGEPADTSGSRVIHRPFIEDALARPYPGMVGDLELYLRRETRAGRISMDKESVAVLRKSVGNLDATTLAGPDLAAWHRLRRQIGAWDSAPN